MLIDGVTDVLLQGVRRVSVQRAEPLKGVGDVQLDLNALGHAICRGGQQCSMRVSLLAVRRQVSASTQNQALSALLFLYRDVLAIPIGDVSSVVRARTPERLPVVLSRDEVGAILKQLTGTTRLFVMLLYGTGLRLEECLDLRVKDIDFDRHQIIVRQGKGRKDRVTMLPVAARETLTGRARVGARHSQLVAFATFDQLWAVR